VVGETYPWLGNYADYDPARNYQKKYPYTENDPVYKDYFAHRHQHKAKKRLFVAEHYNPNNNSPFSFIPLVEKNGLMTLIDIYPILVQDPEINIPGSEKGENGVFSCSEETAMKINYHLLNMASHVVVGTNQNGSPKSVDMSLQRTYFKEIYGITNQRKVIKDVYEGCPPEDEEEELEEQG
jgi:hypothetical protein